MRGVSISTGGAAPGEGTMHSHSKAGKRKGRFLRKYGQAMFLGFVTLTVAGLVALLMWLLNTPARSGP